MSLPTPRLRPTAGSEPRPPPERAQRGTAVPSPRISWPHPASGRSAGHEGAARDHRPATAPVRHRSSQRRPVNVPNLRATGSIGALIGVIPWVQSAGADPAKDDGASEPSAAHMVTNRCQRPRNGASGWLWAPNGAFPVTDVRRASTGAVMVMVVVVVVSSRSTRNHGAAPRHPAPPLPLLLSAGH